MSDSNEDGRNATQTRRRFLALVSATPRQRRPGVRHLSGDDGGDGGSDGEAGTTTGQQISLSDFRGSGPLVAQREAPGGTSIEDLPDLSGELTLYQVAGRADSISTSSICSSSTTGLHRSPGYNSRPNWSTRFRPRGRTAPRTCSSRSTPARSAR